MVLAIPSASLLTFNRTIVELKQRYVSWYNGDIAAFNRTIVELKHRTSPLSCVWQSTFNRTIVELKLYYVHVNAFNRTIEVYGRLVLDF